MSISVSAALFTSQLTATTTPAALAAQPCQEVAVQNDPASATALLVGNSLHQYLSLAPGDTIVLGVNNANNIWLKAAAGTPTVNILIRN